MAQHVGMRLDAEIGSDGCPLDHAGEAGHPTAAHRVPRQTQTVIARIPTDAGGVRAFRARSEDGWLACRSWPCRHRVGRIVFGHRFTRRGLGRKGAEAPS
jgi:hypothetical protein